MIETFHRPKSAPEAVRLKKRLGERAIFLAGGTFANSIEFPTRPEQWINLEGLKLDRITERANGDVQLGALCTLQKLLEDKLVPGPLQAAVFQVVSRNIRNMATIGGHVAARRPQSDLLPMLVALGARVVFSGAAVGNGFAIGQVIGIEGKGRPGGGNGLITKIILPHPSRKRAAACGNLRDSANARSILSAAVSLLPDQGAVRDVIIAVSGLGEIVTRLSGAEEALEGKPLPSIDELQRLISAGVKAKATAFAGAGFLRYQAGALTALTLKRALASRRASGDKRRVRVKIKATVNGVPREFEASAGERVRDLLRRERILSVRNGCDAQGSCGACSIILDGRTVNSCLLLAPQLEGKAIHTVEHLARNRELSALQSAFVDAGVVQCGYCTPALLLAAQELLTRHDRPSRTQVEDAFSGIFCRCTGYEQMFAAVELASQRLKAPGRTGDTAPRFREDLRLIGKAAPKVDGPRLVRGDKSFVEDMVQAGSCHLKLLGSPHAHAYIKKIDVSAAEALPGVVLVLTYKNSPDTYYNQAGQGFPEPSPYDRRLFGQKMRHVGDRVAAVVAESPEIAEEALKRIKVEYKVLKPVLSIDAASAPGAPLLHNSFVEYVAGAPLNLDNSQADPRDGRIIYQFPIHADPRRNIAAAVSGGIGEIARGLKEAEVVLEREYETSQVQCTPLEPHVVYTRMDGERLVIHASTQVPWHIRRIVARVLGISENQIRVIKERVGGGFGAKQDIVLEDVAAFATWTTGRPVLYRYTREEEFISARTRHPMKIKVTLGARKDGSLTAVQMEVRANTGPYGAHALTVPMNACSKSLPLLLCDNVRFEATTYYSNIPPCGAYQGYGAPQGSYALQLACAEMAEKLGLDHLAFLEKNRVQDGSMLEILKCLGEGREGIPQQVSSCGLGPALTQGAEMIRWGIREESDDPDVKIGKGVAMIQQASGLPGLDSANASVTLLGDGTVMLLSGGTDLGTGLDTLVTKMVAECLAMRMGDVSLIAADTDVTPYDDGAYASSGTFFSGSAALNAAQDLKEKIIREAARLLGEPAGHCQVVYPSTVKGNTGSVSFAEISRATQSGTGVGQLSGTAGFTTDKAAFPYGAHYCQVAVNMRTGQVRIQKYFALQDCGTPINPELALGQIYGGVLKTIGHSMFEEMLFDREGRCLNANLRDYRVPMIQDLPEEFKALLVETNDPFGPFGAKSVSEISCNGAAPALAAAIHDATGVWMRSWPFTAEKILQALGKIPGPAAKMHAK